MDSLHDMAQVRQAIDSLDQQLIATLAERQRLVERAGDLKKGQPTDAVRAPDRVAQVIAARRESAESAGLDPDVAEAVWRAMIDAFIALELRAHQE